MVSDGISKNSVTLIYLKVALRIIPLIFVGYVLVFLNGVNIGFAKLQMAAGLGLSDVAYGLGAGIFFIGYLGFEVPSNLAACIAV